MADLWPWLAVAGLGALHGLNPATGWAFAAACERRPGCGPRVLPALLPIGIGHAAGLAAAAWAAWEGFVPGHGRMLAAAAALLAAASACSALARPRGEGRGRALVLRAGLALWASLMAMAHGTSLMLISALTPLCLAGGPAAGITASGSAAAALAATGVHMGAMLASTAAMAAVAHRGIAACGLQPSCTSLPRAGLAALAIAGLLFMAA